MTLKELISKIHDVADGTVDPKNLETHISKLSAEELEEYFDRASNESDHYAPLTWGRTVEQKRLWELTKSIHRYW